VLIYNKVFSIHSVFIIHLRQLTCKEKRFSWVNSFTGSSPWLPWSIVFLSLRDCQKTAGNPALSKLLTSWPDIKRMRGRGQGPTIPSECMPPVIWGPHCILPSKWSTTSQKCHPENQASSTSGFGGNQHSNDNSSPVRFH
jgi:hypothetical protein